MDLLPHKMRRDGRAFLLLLPPLAFMLLFFFYPLLRILAQGVSGAAVTTLLRRPYFWQTAGFTLGQALLSTLLTLLCGLPLAYLLARWEFPGRRLLRAVATVPFVMPTVVVAAAFEALLGPAGPLNRLLQSAAGAAEPPLQLQQTLTIILLAHIYYNIAIVVRLVGGFWANLNPNLADAARLLGAGRLRAFLTITLPLLRPALVGAALLTFLFTFTSFGVILILGGPAFRTLETEIYRQYVVFLRPDVAATLSLLQILFTFLLMSAYSRWQQRSGVPLDLRPRRIARQAPRGSSGRAILLVVTAGAFLLLAAPLLALVARSFLAADGGWTLANYQALSVSRAGRTAFVPPLRAVANSVGFASLTMLLAGGLGLATATALHRAGGARRWLDALFMLPLGASAVTLGFGYLIGFTWLRTSPLLVLIAHTLVALPFVVRSLLPVLQGIRPVLREAAAVHGANPRRVWREIDLPLVGRALLVGLIFAFTVSMGEFGATSFIARPNSGFLTLPIAIERFLGLPGAVNFGQALALSAILMGVCAAGFIGIERFRYAEIGEF